MSVQDCIFEAIPLFACSKCDCLYESEFELLLHSGFHMKSPLRIDPRRLLKRCPCSICGHVAPSKSALTRHRKEHLMGKNLDFR